MQILDKLNSNLREIQKRTLKTVLFKLKSSRISLSELMEPNLTKKLLSLLGHSDDVEMDQDILQILLYFIEEPRGLYLLGTLGSESLREYVVKNPGNNRAEEILTAVSEANVIELQSQVVTEPEMPHTIDQTQYQISERMYKEQKLVEDRRKIALPTTQTPSARLLMFDPVNLTPDEETHLISWVNLLSGIPLPEKIEVELFDKICSTIGAQIFLQRSGLLKKVLDGFNSNNQLRVDRSIYYVSLLVSDWHRLVRKFARESTWDQKFPDSSNYRSRQKQFSTETFLTSGFVSGDYKHIPSELGDSVYTKDDWIDIGLASVFIYQESVNLLRYNAEAGSIIRKVGVFLKPYLESLQLNTHQQQIDLSNQILSLVVVIWDQIHASSSPYFIPAVEVELMCLGLELVEYLAPLLNDTSYLISLIMEYLSDSSITILEFISTIFLTGGPGKDSYKALSSIFQISSMRMKKVIAAQGLKAKLIPEYLEDLKNCLFSSKPFSNSKAKESEFCKKVLYNWSNLSPEALRQHVPTLASFYSLDEGRTVNGLLKKIRLSEAEQIIYNLRGLLSRDERFREESSKLLDLKFEDNLGLKDVFVFSPSFLSLMANFPIEPIGIPLSIDAAVNLLQKFNQETNAVKIAEAFSVLRHSLQDKTTRDTLLQHNLFKTLLEVLKCQIESKSVSFDLINCLKTVIQNDGNSLQLLVKNTDLILRLTPILAGCDEKARFEISKLFAFLCFDSGKPTNETLNLPQCVVDSFFLYEVGLDGPNPSGFPRSLTDCVWETFAISQSPEFHSKMLLDNLEELRKSSNHSEFLDSLSCLSRLASHPSFGFFFLRNGIVEMLSKFLLNAPASKEDSQVLLSVLEFLQILPSNHDTLTDLLLQSWPCLLALNQFEDTGLTVDLKFEVLQLLSCWISKLDTAVLEKLLVQKSLLPKVLEQMEAPANRLPIITILLNLTNLNGFVDCLEKQVLSEIVSTNVQFIHSNAETKNQNFRKAVYFSCMLLRNISRLMVGKDFPSDWHACWLIDNSMDWLSIILNHQEDEFQMCAISFIGNLIMSNQTFIELCNSIPYFIDSCISIITSEFESLEKKKEAVILISNFFLSLKFRSDPSQSVLDSDDSEWKRNGFQIVEQIFGVIPELLESHYQPLTDAATLLIFNLCCANRHLMRKILKDYFVFNRLFEVPPKANDEQTSLEYFCDTENSNVHKDSRNSTFNNLIRFCAILIEGDAEYCRYLVDQTDFLSYLRYVLENADLKSFDFSPACCILFTQILQTYTLDNFEFGSLQLPVVNVFELVSECIQNVEEPIRLSGYAFLSQYLWWTISLEQIEKISAAITASTDVVRILIENLFAYGEDRECNAIENCLQQFLSRFNFAKEIALREYLFSRIEKQLSQIITGKIDDAVLTRISSMVILVSSLCVNHNAAKTICCTTAFITILSKILLPNDTRFVKIHSSATDAFKSLIMDSEVNSSKVCSSSSAFPSLAEMLVVYLSRPNLPIGLFEDYLSCIQVLAAQKSSSGLLIKKGLISKLILCFFGSVRSKKLPQITSFLDLFLILSNSKEVQIGLVRIPELVDNLLELVVWKNDDVCIPSLELCRRLLLQRENKSVFLSNENFYSIISLLLKSKSPQVVNLATSILWVFMYDFEKAKVDFKKYDFEKILTGIESQRDDKSDLLKENKELAKTVLQLVGK